MVTTNSTVARRVFLVPSAVEATRVRTVSPLHGTQGDTYALVPMINDPAQDGLMSAHAWSPPV